MEFAFYICGLIAILATLRVITHTNRCMRCCI